MNFPEGQEVPHIPDNTQPCRQSAEYMEKLAKKKEAENDQNV